MRKLIGKIMSRNKHSVKMFYTYSVIIILSILINQLGYVSAVSTIKKGMERESALACDNVRKVFDVKLSDIYNTAYMFLHSDSLTKLKELPGRDELLEKEISNNIVYTISGDGIISDTHIVIPGKDLSIDENGGSSFTAEFDNYFSKFYKSADRFKDSIAGAASGKFELFFNDKNAFATPRMVYICRKPEIDASKEVIVFIEINCSKLNGLLYEMRKDSYDSYFMIDDMGDVVFTGNLTVIPNVNDKSYTISRSRSQKTGLTYVYALPNSVYLKNIRLVRFMFFLGYLLCVALCGGLAYLFAKMYESRKKKQDELVERQMYYVRKDMIANILSGKKNVDENVMVANKLYLTGSYFYVFIFEQLSDEKVDTFIYQCIAVKFNNLISHNDNVYFCDVGESYVAIASFVIKPNNLEQKVNTILSEIKNENQSELFCVISPCVGSVSEISYAYIKANEIINLRFIENEKSVFMYEDVMQINGNYKYTISTEEKLINYLLFGKIKEVNDLINEIWDYNINTNKLNLHSLHLFAFDIVSTYFKVYSQMNLDEHIDNKELYDFSQLIFNTKNPEILKERLIELADNICEINTNTKTATNVEERCEKIKKYIFANYSNPEINVNKVAEVFGLTPNWMSKYFKAQVGENMADFIIRCRITQAKELLRNTDKYTNQIALEIGFSNVGVFQKAFKRYENLTPSQYRIAMTEK